MAQVIIYEQNGQVAVCTPTGELPIKEVLAKDCPAGAIIVDTSELPTDNEYFNAWELVDGVVLVNLEKAKVQTKDRLRTERAPFLVVQDVLFQRALESGQDTSAIVTEKNRLRDITKLADVATSLDELRAIKP